MKFRFTLTRDVTESTTVTIDANSIEEAHAKALENPPTEGWAVDDNPPNDAYLPDPSDFEGFKPTPCGGCGETVPGNNCIGCFHDFYPGLS
jgi:hypothetical protein